jgi:hypothetical protein
VNALLFKPIVSQKPSQIILARSGVACTSEIQAVSIRAGPSNIRVSEGAVLTLPAAEPRSLPLLVTGNRYVGRFSKCSIPKRNKKYLVDKFAYLFLEKGKEK